MVHSRCSTGSIQRSSAAFPALPAAPFRLAPAVAAVEPPFVAPSRPPDAPDALNPPIAITPPAPDLSLIGLPAASSATPPVPAFVFASERALRLEQASAVRASRRVDTPSVSDPRFMTFSYHAAAREWSAKARRTLVEATQHSIGVAPACAQRLLFWVAAPTENLVWFDGHSSRPAPAQPSASGSE